MQTSVVTGGAGFIGSHLVRKLLERGDRVIVFDNFSSGSMSNLEDIQSAVSIINGDVRDAEAIDVALKGADVVFHLAAISSVLLSVDKPQPTWEVNLQGTWNTLEACRKSDVKRLVFASSASVYGSSTEYPFKEDITLQGSSPYATSKLIGERICGLYQRLYDLETSCLRFFSVYGPRQNPKSQYSAVIPTFATLLLSETPPTIYGDGSQTRDFIYVEDIVRAIVIASEAREAVGQVFNVGSGVETSIKRLYNHICDSLGASIVPQFAPLKPGDDPRTLADTSKAAELLKFEAAVDLTEGLQKTIRWFKETTSGAGVA